VTKLTGSAGTRDSSVANETCSPRNPVAPALAMLLASVSSRFCNAS
jgi:hypothetical protein